MNDETKTTPGVTYFYQGDGQTHPLFRIAEGIPCRSAREQASEQLSWRTPVSPAASPRHAPHHMFSH
ncbi:hypothetical protein QQ994_24340 [Pseudomonas asiatica]|uniref:hypothetical protein n=1 Tax=Pseudomonas sp. X4 TaxID=3231526 RepID=UPI00256FF54C|nr:hypothetical protein [Pseudomonas asiatica]WJD73069.1 hypothetical protein QQ994_24340 [Pseudomonas asiatica]